MSDFYVLIILSKSFCLQVVRFLVFIENMDSYLSVGGKNEKTELIN